ncbi:hypothetical protein MPTK1_8g13500 [Marchantia polymorpha subsp. ruderalis]|uniref:GPI inositol-deacylase n=2 Tax=Marchantia polymorpha TaxID=3197 RepID=A0A176VKY3_MARPO|nr:hypothetical protein AXG93_1478s1020 [Marchantia polymorpha subsp. ruderalis]PTQ31543.1 hypothetical protein MARPO_0110s0034 [Marchantia polymorpha]BBN19771.1 hypothetical protein Mp_8g13500 [Marchantia polymorpha subsp. ruderalis]|eukprot:PTQ31543.1 hypothetical protein MARPO_0110s0034 [Marchantia polymorpha]
MVVALPTGLAMQVPPAFQSLNVGNAKVGGVSAASSVIPRVHTTAKFCGVTEFIYKENSGMSRKNVVLRRTFGQWTTSKLQGDDESIQRDVLVAKSVSVRAADAETPETVEPNARTTKQCRPCVILPGLGNNTSDYNALVSDLEARNVSATVVQVARADWLRNASGLLDGNYWKGTLSPRPVLNWYLERMKAAIDIAKAGAGGDGKVSLIGHSAGGWLARVYMAEFGTQDIALLLTLGTPHLPPPRGIPGVFDQTRGLLYYVENNCPGAYHAPDVKYVCIAGRYVKGSPFGTEQTPVATTGVGTLDLEEVDADTSEAPESPEQVAKTAEAFPSFRERFVGAGYKQVCGKANVWGDGVVPEESAYLEGALNISFDGVYHSPVGASSERPWYGTVEVLDKWVHHLLE